MTAATCWCLYLLLLTSAVSSVEQSSRDNDSLGVSALLHNDTLYVNPQTLVIGYVTEVSPIEVETPSRGKFHIGMRVRIDVREVCWGAAPAEIEVISRVVVLPPRDERRHEGGVRTIYTGGSDLPSQFLAKPGDTLLMLVAPSDNGWPRDRRPAIRELKGMYVPVREVFRIEVDPGTGERRAFRMSNRPHIPETALTRDASLDSRPLDAMVVLAADDGRAASEVVAQMVQQAEEMRSSFLDAFWRKQKGAGDDQ